MTPTGFGKPRPIQLVAIKENTQADHDRVAAAYKKQGLSPAEARRMLGVSVLQFVAAKAGYQQGADYSYSPERGAWFSESLTGWLREHLPAHVLEGVLP